MGYSTVTLRSGALATGASFNTIASKGMKLSQILPSGYLSLAYWADGKRGGFKDMITLTVLDAYGNVSKDKFDKGRCFKWRHEWDKTNKWAAKGYWYRNGDPTDIISTENDETFDPGEGLWVEVAGGAYASATKATADQYKFTNNGEAMFDAANITMRSGALAVMPTLSKDMNLSQILPAGYMELAYWADGKRGGFKDMVTVTVLDAYGNVAKDKSDKGRCFKWRHEWDKTNKWAAKGYWYRNGDPTDIISSENEEVFKMGEGLWVEVAGGAYASATKAKADQYFLQFPGMDDTYVTEEE